MVIAHQSRMVTDGLAALLAAETSIVVTATIVELPSFAGDDAPDVLVLDPDLADDETFVSLRRRAPQMRILLIADANTPERNIRFLAAGAAGLVDRTAGAEAVAHAILTVTHDHGVAPRQYIKIAADRLATAYGDHLDSLDEDEVALWRHVVEGLDYAAIAEAHFVSERTARRHVDALLEKLGVDNRLQAAELAGRVFLRDRQPAPDED